jgi:hypothetical protein
MCNPRSDGTHPVVAILWRSVSTASRAVHVPLSPLGSAIEGPVHPGCIT